MKHFRHLLILILLLTISWVIPLWSGNTGKIAGTITDKATGESFQEVQIAIDGSSLSTVSDARGRYIILAVPPGKHTVQFSFPEYRNITVRDVQVYIDQTAWINVAMDLQPSINDTLDWIAEDNTIRPDVTTSSVTISNEQVQELPINNVVSAIGLQAGIRGGWNSALGSDRIINRNIGVPYFRGKVIVQGDLTIRGGDGDNILFLVDGVTMRDPRNNEPLTKIPLSAVEEVSVERNGFNAEYGQVRSGIVHVITKEGSKQGYSGNIQVRYAPPAPKYWNGPGIRDVQDPYSYLLRPFFDPAVCWTGTDNGTWDFYTQRQYLYFEGWNEISRHLYTDNDPTNDLTPAGAQRVFMYEVRKNLPRNQPDYDIDAGFGGPVPLISQILGNLRFFTSLRTHREMLLFPLTRPDYRDYDWTLQLNSDITPSIKLSLLGIFGKQYTIRDNSDASGIYVYPRSAEEVANATDDITTSSDLYKLFSDFYFSLADIGYRSVAARLTHTLSSKTFYEVSLEHFRREYNVRPTALRDTSRQYEIIPGYFEDSNPFGYWPWATKGLILTGTYDAALARDFTVVSSTTLKADFSHQVTFQNLVKTGFEIVYNDLDFDYGTIMPMSEGKIYNSRIQVHGFPIRAALYVQDKFEIKKLTINAGLRLDYSNLNVDFFNIDPNSDLFISPWSYVDTLTTSKQASKPQWQLNPRFNIAWAFTRNSKLFFNYGHFRQTAQYENLFRVPKNAERQIASIGDPNIKLAKTVSYELGLDQTLFTDFLLQAAAFYNDISDLQDFTTFFNLYGYSHSQPTANYFEDTRGLELTLRKTSGRWWSGFANYTYQKIKSGFKGSSRHYSDPYSQRIWDREVYLFNHDHVVPQPYARTNINLHTPEDFGPSVGRQKVLAGLNLNVLLDWQAGYWTTYNPMGISTAWNNVQAVDYFNVALRLQKTFNFGKFSVQFFMDMDNVLNTPRLWISNGQWDNAYYMASLHLPKSDAYYNIPGHDKVGDYRKPGIEFQPMEYIAELDRNWAGQTRPIYFDGKTGQYWQYVDNPRIPVYQRWTRVDQSRIDKINKDKAYIDMPNTSTFWFLNPRTFFLGLNVSFHFND